MSRAFLCSISQTKLSQPSCPRSSNSRGPNLRIPKTPILLKLHSLNKPPSQMLLSYHR